MKLAVIADSHDNTDSLIKAVQIANIEKCDHLLHLGDIVSPFAVFKLQGFNGKITAVFGNNDGEVLGLQKSFNKIGGEIYKPPLKLMLEDKKILLMHEPFLLDELAGLGSIDYIFYGHLHKVDFRQVGTTFILNPGEAGGWVEVPSFYMVDTTANGFKKIDLLGI
jgi:putative phosphoesterase